MKLKKWTDLIIKTTPSGLFTERWKELKKDI